MSHEKGITPSPSTIDKVDAGSELARELEYSDRLLDELTRRHELLAYDDALKSANKLTTRANIKLGKLLFISNDNSNGDEPEGYSSGGRINTYNKGYGGRGFKISPEVIEFKRIITTESAISE